MQTSTNTTVNTNPTLKNNRDITIDLIKGIGIILMVLRHARAPYSEFVMLFHMAIFFIVSGYLYKDSYADTIKSLRKYIVRKIKGLWLPYFLYTTLFILLHNIFIKLNIYTDNPLLLSAGGSEYNSVKELMSLTDMCKEIVKAIFFRADTQLGGAFWFFEILFFTLVFYAIVDYIVKKLVKNNKKHQLIIQAILSLFFLFAGYYCCVNKMFIGGYVRILLVYFLIYTGVLFKEFSLANKIFSKLNPLIISVICLVVLIIAKQFGNINIGGSKINNPVFFMIVSLAGYLMLYGLAIFLQKFKNKIISYILNAITYISKRSVSIIALHFLCFKPISWISVLVLCMNKYMIASFPVLFESGIYWLAYTLAGILVPLLLDFLYLKIKKAILKTN